MLYNVHISQIALSDIGIQDLDYNDLAIFNAIEYMCASNNITKQVIKSKQYSLISWKLIVKQLPFLQHNSRATIKSRIKKLEDAGLIEPSPDNTILQNSYYRMGNLYDDYKVKKETPRLNNDTPAQNLEHPRPENKTAPVQKIRRNNSIIDNNINNNKVTERNSITKSKVLELFNSSYPKSINRATLEPTIMQFDGNLNELVNGLQRYSKYCKATKPKLQHITDATNFIKYKKYLNGFEYTEDPEEEYIKAMPKLKIVRADR